MKSPPGDRLGAESSALLQPGQTSSAARVVAFCRAHRLLVLFLVAFAVRVAFIVAFGAAGPPPQRADDQAYDDIAYRLVTQHQYTNDWYPPGYPLFLALNYAVFGRSWFLARLVQAALGAATCLLIYRLGAKVFADREGLLAGFLLAIYPGHVFFCWRLMAEPLYILLLTWSLLVALSLAENPQPLRAFALGALVGVDQLVKANLFLFPAMLLVWLAFSARGNAKRRVRCLAALIAGLVLTALIQPMVNRLSPAGQAHALPGNAGTSLWQGNNPTSSGFSDWHDEYPNAQAFINSHGFAEQLKTATSFERDRLYRTMALTWIRENPGRFLALFPMKLNNAFGLFPRAHVFEGNSQARIVHLLAYGFIAPFALGGMIVALRRWRATSLLYVVLASYVPTVLLFWGTPRYTLLVIPELLIFASFAMLAVYTRIVGSRRLAHVGDGSGTFS